MEALLNSPDTAILWINLANNRNIGAYHEIFSKLGIKEIDNVDTPTSNELINKGAFLPYLSEK